MDVSKMYDEELFHSKLQKARPSWSSAKIVQVWEMLVADVKIEREYKYKDPMDANKNPLRIAAPPELFGKSAKVSTSSQIQEKTF